MNEGEWRECHPSFHCEWGKEGSYPKVYLHMLLIISSQFTGSISCHYSSDNVLNLSLKPTTIINIGILLLHLNNIFKLIHD